MLRQRPSIFIRVTAINYINNIHPCTNTKLMKEELLGNVYVLTNLTRENERTYIYLETKEFVGVRELGVVGEEGPYRNK